MFNNCYSAVLQILADHVQKKEKTFLTCKGRDKNWDSPVTTLFILVCLLSVSVFNIDTTLNFLICSMSLMYIDITKTT